MTLWLLPLLGLVAFLYAAVGNAGASGYIAVLALAGLPAEQIKPLALILNIPVAAQGSWQFQRAGHLRWRLFWPVLLAGLPMAFLGGWLDLPTLWFQRLVALVLLAGLTGTGGGVFLTPLLLACSWASTRQAAAVSSLFIFGNSLSGLAGLLLARQPSGALLPALPAQLGWMLLMVLLAGAVGSRLGSRHWPVAWIRRCLALVLLLAALKLLGFAG
ncbi:hypothetical protein OGCDGJMD_02612 [Cyanobium usitatum str. Tous]|uniref:TSUP family transporter n=1 Tax=Cyanobium usitatum TaxID=2304190 RepID=UPI002AD2811F|nr:TSUP family transporter [Cyanobium usitatum]CAK6699211.1 hypothetical protein OGCDGJMD_02612 [Cyanobium usitatum str. Tous]